MAKLLEILKANIPAFRNSSFPDILNSQGTEISQEVQPDGGTGSLQEIPTD
jgi:hypothetical protein